MAIETQPETAREAAWSQLQTALRHAAGLGGAEELRNQAEAIKENRSLLADTDPVQPLLSQATDLLREALTECRNAYTDAYEAHLDDLEASESWQGLDAATRTSLLTRHGLDEVPDIDVSTTDSVLDTLGEMPLDSWDARLDALPQRFDKALSDAVHELEPDTVRVQLDSRVLKTEDEVEEWLNQARTKLLRHVQDGHPVQV